MIVAPTDFSPVSLNAAVYAADLAADIHTHLLLVNVIELPFTPTPLTAESYNVTLQHSRRELFKLQEKLIARTGNTINIETHIGIGSLMSELNKICNVHEPFAVVMGTEERDMVEKFFIGNSTQTAVRYLQSPVLVVPATATYKKVGKICLACDLKDIYNLPLQPIKRLVTAFNAKLEIVHVCKNEKERLQDYLAAALTENQLRGLQVKIEFVINKDVDKGIQQYVAQHGDDMLLIIPKKRSFFEEIFHKSYTKKCSTHPLLPVIHVLEPAAIVK